MAQLLYERDSTTKHLNAARRHMRLCRRFNRTDLADSLKQFFDVLIARQNDTEAKIALREDAYDDLMLADQQLDDAVRDAFTATQTHDRAHMMATAMKHVFPDEKFGDIIHAPVMSEPDLVEQLAVRFESLGEAHALYAQAALLRERITASRGAIADYETAVRNVKLAEAEEEIAQANLRRQYEANYLNARMTVGRIVADRLYPSLSKVAGTVPPPETK